MYYCAGLTEKGNRPNNEDAFLINKSFFNDGNSVSYLSPPFVIAVADGVSGNNYGEIASKICLSTLKGIRCSSKTDWRKKALHIHAVVKRHGITHPNHANMQTTLCMLAVDEKNFVSAVNIGDSRLYLFRNCQLRQLSKDQSLVQLLYERGCITSGQKRTHPQKNIILPAIGNVSEPPKPDVTNFNEKMKYGDLFILCTDGLSDYVSEHEIEEILNLPMNLTKRLALLTKTALENGSQDNITIVGISPIQL